MYTNISELPATIRDVLPPEAQELYLRVYNESMEMALSVHTQSMPREGLAHQLAWDAVTREFVHDEHTNVWYRQGEAPVADTEEQKGILQRIREMF